METKQKERRPSGKPVTLIDIRRKAEITSEIYYRSGLSKAAGGDLTGAAEELDLSVRYDKHHEDARNLLGLVWFQMGELGEAMKQWGISEHLNPVNNRATYYMNEIRGEMSLLMDMSEAISLYNEALEFVGRGENDYAIARLKKAASQSPHYVKAQLLLSLLYIEGQSYKAALAVLDQVAKVDPLNPEAMRYRLQIAQAQKEGRDDLSLDIQDLSRDIYVQMSLPEPDKGEISNVRRRRKAVSGLRGTWAQIGLIAVGLLLGAGFMYYLYVPGQLREYRQNAREMTIQSADMKEENERLESQLSKAKETLRKIGVEGAEGDEVMRSDIRRLLNEWDGSEK